MSRVTYVLRDGKLVEKSKAVPLTENKSATIIKDIQPYRSTLTGEMVTSRSQHRRLLKQHNCIEVGSEDIHKHTKPPEYKRGDIKADIKKSLEQLR